MMPDLIDIEEFFADPEFAEPIDLPGRHPDRLPRPAPRTAQVWVRGVDEEHDDAVCVTRDTRRGITSYYWTDDPRWLLYLQDTDGNEDWHLYRVDLDDPGRAGRRPHPAWTRARASSASSRCRPSRAPCWSR